jgi:hypothetical protein
MLNQKERQPLSVADQVASIYSGTGGYLDRIKTDRVQEFLARLIDRLHSENGELMKGINESGQLSDDDEETLGKAIADAVDDFGPDYDKEGNLLEEGESDRVHSEEEQESPGRTEESDAEDQDAGSDPENAENSEDADESGGSDPSRSDESDSSAGAESETEEAPA